MPRELDGLRVLVVEDELLVAEVLGAMLEELGVVVDGEAADLATALAAADSTGCNVAMVDLHLGGESAWPVVDRLCERGIKVVVMSGDSGPRAQRPGLIVLNKPYQFEQLRQILQTVAVGGA